MSTTLFETHVYFGWFLDPHLTTLRLNIGDQLREVIERCQHTLRGPIVGIFNYTIQFYVVLAMDSSHLIRDSKQKTSSGPNLIEQIYIWLMHSLVCTQDNTPKNEVFICIPKIWRKWLWSQFGISIINCH